jgi:hypothetical protein
MSQYANDGTYLVCCPVCGFNKYSDEMRRRWDGVMVCSEDWEPRHPIEFFRAKEEKNDLPFTLPEGTSAETDTSAWVGIGETDNRGTPT